MRYALTATALALISLTVIAVAQNQTLKFEVATIKPDQQGRRPNVVVMGGSCHGADKQYPPGGQFAPPPLGRCVLTRVNLMSLIGIAYKVGVGVSGGPGWASADYFDVEGKAEDSTATEAQLLVIVLPENVISARFTDSGRRNGIRPILVLSLHLESCRGGDIIDTVEGKQRDFV